MSFPLNLMLAQWTGHEVGNEILLPRSVPYLSHCSSHYLGMAHLAPLRTRSYRGHSLLCARVPVGRPLSLSYRWSMPVYIHPFSLNCASQNQQVTLVWMISLKNVQHGLIDLTAKGWLDASSQPILVIASSCFVHIVAYLARCALWTEQPSACTWQASSSSFIVIVLSIIFVG